MNAELVSAYTQVVMNQVKEASVTVGTREVKFQRENVGPVDANNVPLTTKESVIAYIDGKKQEESAVTLGIVGILNLLAAEPTSPTQVQYQLVL